MSNTKPESDFKNYGNGLKTFSTDEPVFPITNGQDRNTTPAIEKCEKMEAIIKLMAELSKGKQSGHKWGWLSLDDISANLGI